MTFRIAFSFATLLVCACEPRPIAPPRRRLSERQLAGAVNAGRQAHGTLSPSRAANVIDGCAIRASDGQQRQAAIQAEQETAAAAARGGG